MAFERWVIDLFSMLIVEPCSGLNCVLLQKRCPSPNSQLPVTVTSFVNRVFAIVTKARIKMRSPWIRVGPKANDSNLIGKEKRDFYPQGRGHVNTKAEMEVMLSQARKCQELQEAGKVLS